MKRRKRLEKKVSTRMKMRVTVKKTTTKKAVINGEMKAQTGTGTTVRTRRPSKEEIPCPTLSTLQSCLTRRPSREL